MICFEKSHSISCDILVFTIDQNNKWVYWLNYQILRAKKNYSSTNSSCLDHVGFLTASLKFSNVTSNTIIWTNQALTGYKKKQKLKVSALAVLAKPQNFYQGKLLGARDNQKIKLLKSYGKTDFFLSLWSAIDVQAQMVQSNQYFHWFPHFFERKSFDTLYASEIYPGQSHPVVVRS